MNFQDWLDVKFTDEETLSIEREARELEKSGDTVHVARTCIALLKQSRYQSKLLERAVNRIGFLEMEIEVLSNLGRKKP
tara:strand:- start:96 stop:332 length:237 start_codon:yes stop_codon:yes gene_type:complete